MADASLIETPINHLILIFHKDRAYSQPQLILLRDTPTSAIAKVRKFQFNYTHNDIYVYLIAGKATESIEGAITLTRIHTFDSTQYIHDLVYQTSNRWHGKSAAEMDNEIIQIHSLLRSRRNQLNALSQGGQSLGDTTSK